MVVVVMVVVVVVVVVVVTAAAAAAVVVMVVVGVVTAAAAGVMVMVAAVVLAVVAMVVMVVMVLVWRSWCRIPGVKVVSFLSNKKGRSAILDIALQPCFAAWRWGCTYGSAVSEEGRRVLYNKKVSLICLSCGCP